MTIVLRSMAMSFSFMVLFSACGSGGGSSPPPPPAEKAKWTWMAGSYDGDVAGSYGTKGQADPYNAPGGRYSAPSWVDAKGNLWMFGGYSTFGDVQVFAGPTNDLWKYDRVANLWTWVSGSSGGGASSVYGIKGVASAANVPGARMWAAFWTDPSGKFWLFGGRGPDSTGNWLPLNDLWRFDPTTSQWTWIAGSDIGYQKGIYGTKGVAAPGNVPGAREFPLSWVDSDGKLWLYSGNGLDFVGETQGPLNDLWRFDPQTLEWKWVAGRNVHSEEVSYGTKGVSFPSNDPGPLEQAVTWTDGDDNLWLFGGGEYLNALWKFDTTKLEWTWVSGSDRPNDSGNFGTKGITSASNVPPARRGAVGWPGAKGEFWLFGGWGSSTGGASGLLNDLWKYDPATKQWTWVGGSSALHVGSLYGSKGEASESNSPGGRANSVGWKTVQGELWLFGGEGLCVTGEVKRLGELWRYGSIGQTTPPSSAVRVTLSPDSAAVDVTESVQFLAMVHNAPNDAVTWSLAGAGCSGDACGTISSTGLYTAPASAPSSATVTVKATSVADPSKSASATVTIANAAVIVTMAPDTANVYAGESLLFRTSVEHTTEHGVTWSLSGTGCSGGACGTIGSTGLYTAPANVPVPAIVTVTATSIADPSKSASATISILEPAVNQWAWISGSDAINQPGVRGDKGVPGPLNIPCGRDGVVSWADASGGLWLFGGFADAPYQQGLYNDLWMYDTASREWTWIGGSDLVNRKGAYGEPGVPDPSNMPGAREGGATWTDRSGFLWLFGGSGYGIDANTTGELSDLWRYEPATGIWTWVSGNRGLYWGGYYGTKGAPDPANKPGGRYGAVSWTDGSGNLWLFGGRGYDSTTHSTSGLLNDLWKYEPATNEWTWISGSSAADQWGIYGTKGGPEPPNVPGGRQSAVGWIDSQGRLWIFGGTGLDSSGLAGTLNDLWSFDPVSLEWTWVSGSNLRGQAGVYGTLGVADPSKVPGARCPTASWRDSEDRLWLFGGAGLDSAGLGGDLNDLWSFDTTTLQWTWVSGSSTWGFNWGSYGTRGVADPSNTPGQRNSAVSWTDHLGGFWLFGGSGLGAPPNINGKLNDLWKFYR